jgi:hypothetical protein
VVSISPELDMVWLPDAPGDVLAGDGQVEIVTGCGIMACCRGRKLANGGRIAELLRATPLADSDSGRPMRGLPGGRISSTSIKRSLSIGRAGPADVMPANSAATLNPVGRTRP